MNASPELLTEINATIERYLAEQGSAPANWVTQDIVNRHKRIEGPDADFCLKCTHDNVREEVRRAIRRYDIKPQVAADPQLTLEGFTRLQKVYSVMRNGEPVAVAIEHCSTVELKAKRNELRQMGDGCYEHADEIDRYLDQRDAA